MGEEDEEEEEEEDQARGEGSAETRGAGKKRVARPSGRRKAVPDHFVGEPVPDGEARQRWPQRYAAKVRTMVSLLSVSGSDRSART
jgi:hypothetical protein